jgi:hypothetical protein
MFEIGQRVVRTEDWAAQHVYAGDEGVVTDVSGLGKPIPVLRVKFDDGPTRTVLASKMEPRNIARDVPRRMPAGISASEFRELVKRGDHLRPPLRPGEENRRINEAMRKLVFEREMMPPPVVVEKGCPVLWDQVVVVDCDPDLGMFIRDGMTSAQARSALERGIPIGFDKALDKILRKLPKVRASVPGPRTIRHHPAPANFRGVEERRSEIPLIWGRQ